MCDATFFNRDYFTLGFRMRCETIIGTNHIVFSCLKVVFAKKHPNPKKNWPLNCYFKNELYL